MNMPSFIRSQPVRDVQEKALHNLDVGHALITRSYLSELTHYPVTSPDKRVPYTRSSDMRIFRVERIVQRNKQSVLESLAAAYTALGAAGYAVFLFLRSDGRETELYIGTRGEPGKMLGQNSGDLLCETFKGHFSGSSLHLQDVQKSDELFKQMEAEKDNPSASITAVTAVPALSTENREHFMQGLECFIDAAENRVYQALILAEPVSSKNLDLIRTGYEQVATQISPLSKLSLTYGEQDSSSIGLNITEGLSHSLGQSLGLTETRGTSQTVGTSTSETNSASYTFGTNYGYSGGFNLGVGLDRIFAGVNCQTNYGSNESYGISNSTTFGGSKSHSTSYSDSIARNQSNTRTTSTNRGQSLNQTDGSTRQMSIELGDKSIEQLLNKIDHHLERIDEAKTYGGWNSAAYFIGDSSASSESLASIFLGLIRGSKSSHEDFALTTWTSGQKSAVIDWLTRLSHPKLHCEFSKNVPVSFVTPATLISGKEMAIQLSLPQRSTSTVSVVETQVFGRKVQLLDGQSPVAEAKDPNRVLNLGNIRHLWENLPQEIKLDMDQLSSHVFISGSTGAGKSNTLYEILDQISAAGVPFLVIEPAKGEYKNVFGQRPNVTVLGTNPAHSDMLRINPFAFPKDIHVLEHVDRLIEIFNVCWPMYAAMPAVLKESVLKAYQNSGWDLDSSRNCYHKSLFPTFVDLQETLQQVITDSVYSAEVKGNYIGSLCTRITSLTNGLNAQLFVAEEIDNTVLFDSNVIVDLSRIGSVETKALIMGVLVMRLSEHRMAKGGMNLPLQHITVIEEAHNILRRSQDSGGEESGLVGKSVEMLTNAIAEMRTYGEGFIIADQSPHAVDIAAIRNTNTKIIMRLPDEADRRLVGKSVALQDDQLEEIARLPQGVAVVYQNNWLEPVLCQIRKFKGTDNPYIYHPRKIEHLNKNKFNLQFAKILLHTRVKSPDTVNTDEIKQRLLIQSLPASIKIDILRIIRCYENRDLHIEQNSDDFARIAILLVDVLGCRIDVNKIIHHANDFTQLCNQLQLLIKKYIPDISSKLSLAVEHGIMKDYSLQDKDNIKIYATWRMQYEERNV